MVIDQILHFECFGRRIEERIVGFERCLGLELLLTFFFRSTY